MKKILVLLYLCALSFSSGIDIPGKDITKKGSKMYYGATVLNGEYNITLEKAGKLNWKSSFNDISVDYEVYKIKKNYKNGKEAGESRAYGKNDELLIVNNKKENGYFVSEFYYNGNLIEKTSKDDVNFLESFFKSGAVLKGPYEFYYKSGQLKEKGDFSIDKFSIPSYTILQSRKTGEVKRYSETGKLKETVVFKDGLRNGNTTYYDENENVLKVEKYSKGIKQ